MSQAKKKYWYRALMASCVVLVFIVTYALILPAITVDQNSASEVGLKTAELQEAQDAGKTVLTAGNHDYGASVIADEDAKLEDADKLTIKEVGGDSYKEAVNNKFSGEGKVVADAQFYDLSLSSSPKEDVKIGISLDKPIKIGDGQSLAVVNYDKDKDNDQVEVLDDYDTEKNGNDEIIAISFKAKSFSIVGVCVLEAAPEEETAEIEEATEDQKEDVAEEETVTDTEKATEEQNEEKKEESAADEEQEADVEKEAAKKPQTFVGKVGNVNVMVTAAGDAFPEGTEMVVNPVSKRSIMGAINDTIVDQEIKGVKAVDITFINKGVEVQPTSPVHVTINSADVAGYDSPVVVHINDNGEGELIGSAEKDQANVAFDAEKFSVYAIVGTEVITTEFLSADGNTYEVTVTYGSDAEIPEGSKLIVTEYAKGTDEFKEAREALTGNAVDNDNGWFYPELREENYVAPAFVGEDGGMSLLDISIVDGAGNEIEPKALVSVKVVMKELPADTETDILENSMELKHFVENEDNDTVEVESLANTVNTYGETGGEIKVSTDSVVAEFDTESFSLFAFTWGSRTANVIVHYVDIDGNEIQGPQTSDVSISQNNATINFSTYEGGITDYTFKEARLGTMTGDVVTGFVTNNYTSTVTFRNGNTNVESRTVPFNAEVYFIYTPDDHPSGGDEGDNVPKPTTEKKLEPAGDGTYTLSLSVTGKKNTSTENTKANVLVIYDTSNSMDDNVAINDYLPTGGNYGRYGLVDGNYVQLYRQRYSGGYAEITNGTTTYDTVYIYTGGNYVPYTGSRYNYYGTDQRHYVSQAAVRELADALLSNNTSDVPDMVEMALIEFDSIAYRVNRGTVSNPGAKTTSYDTFASWVNNITIPGPGNDNNRGGTDWEDALTVANNYSFGDSDPVYIIFVSDGDPTFRVSRNGSSGNGGANTSRSVTMNGRTMTIYGTGSSDTGNYNLDAAVKMATSIIKNNKHLYSVGTFGDADNMQALAGAYYDASDPAKLNQAFADIVKSITNSLTLANVDIKDGLTQMSATTFVQGSVGNFIYHKGNQIWTPEQMAEEGANEATVITAEDGSQTVEWNLGKDYKLEDNVTYKVEFTVWPKQEAYDLLADLNNGLKDYDSLDDDIKKQIIKNGNTYTLLTNTDASITYDVVLEEDGMETGRQPGSATITNPTNGMGLDESHLNVKKEWNDTLDPQQLLNLLDSEPDYSVVLHIRNDNNEYVPVTITPVVTRNEDGKAISATWPTEKVYIAPGVMLSVDKATEKGIDTDKYKKVTYNGTTYVILESGHDYTIDEHNTDYHFELRAETYHPMVVDGTVCNVSFTYDDGGAINGITAIDTTNTGTIVATNELRAGINLRKIVVDSEGEEIYPENEYFYLQVSLKDKDGNPIRFENYRDPEKDAPLHDSPYITDTGDESTVRVGWNTYPIWYNIYYDAYDDLDIEGTHIPEGSQYYERSDGMVVQDGGLIRIKAGDVIRFANVPIGTQVSLKEINVPSGYEFNEYQYKVGKASTEWTTVTDINTGYSASAAANQSYYFTFKNEQKTSDLRIVKTDEKGNAITTATDTAIFKLSKNTKSDGTGAWENATATSGVAEDGTITINTTDGINLVELKDGLYKLQETKAPDGYIVISSPVYFKLNNGSIQFVSVEGSGSSTVITEIDTPDGYTVEGKTDSTPVTLKVANTPGAALPNTGGSGTTIYLLGGLLLIAIAAVMYGTRMRRTERRSEE